LILHFAGAFSALVHDVDHRGIPNGQLAKEDAELAGVYNNKSVAEQNSVDIAWNTLMEGDFEQLRNSIYSNEAELKRGFRQIVVNTVMAADILDKELSALRKNRWDKAFQEKPEGAMPTNSSLEDDVNRKVTIVLEHLIQASDVSHTMQPALACLHQLECETLPGDVSGLHQWPRREGSYGGLVRGCDMVLRQLHHSFG
jgi:hypothetical protein